MVVNEMKLRKKKNDPNQKKDPKPKKFADEQVDWADYNPMRCIQDSEKKYKNKWKIVSLVAKGHCVVGAVFHVVCDDNTGEFDPYFIERIKNCISLMFEKDLIQQLEAEINKKHTYKNWHNAMAYNSKLSLELSAN